MGLVRAWFAHLDGTRTGTLRRVAGIVCCMDAVLVGARPFAELGVERGLYLTVAVALAVNGLLLVVSRGWSDTWGRVLAVTLPTILVLGLLMSTDDVGALPVLLGWSCLAGAYFPKPATAWHNVLLIAVGMAAVVILSEDPEMTWYAWAVVVGACTACAGTVRLIARHGDAIVDRLSDRAARDPLTGLLNRRAFDEQLDAIWTEGGRMSVAFFDLDHFKIVNDTYGHAVGDAVLVEFARVLRGHVRDGDVVARTGGEEFGVVLAGRGVANVLERAQAVVDAFAATRIPADDLVLRCTVSAGVAVRESRHTGTSHLCRDADRALYLAKEAGRNHAVLHDPARALGE